MVYAFHIVIVIAVVETRHLHLVLAELTNVCAVFILQAVLEISGTHRDQLHDLWYSSTEASWDWYRLRFSILVHLISLIRVQHTLTGREESSNI